MSDQLRRTLGIAALAAGGILTANAAAGPPALSVDTVLIGDPGNPADTNGLGSVANPFRLGRFEVGNDQYVVFLNAIAASDPNGVYDDLMTESDRGGILRTGSPGSYAYQVKPDFDDKPVVAIDWLDAARFCNWLHNGQPAGPQGPATTEDGGYDMSVAIDRIARSPGATWFLPTHDEWYKAAYYDPFDPGADAGGSANYWLYPTRADVLPVQAEADDGGDVVNPGPNVANYEGGADWNGENGNVTTSGGCESISVWGLFDLGGNVNEWTETPGNPIPPNPPDQPDPLPTRTIRGGDFANPGLLMSSPPGFAPDLNMVAGGANIGFRVARVPFAEGDVDGDGLVDVDDLVAVVLEWGLCPPPPATCDADVNGDDRVNVDDLVAVILNWT